MSKKKWKGPRWKKKRTTRLDAKCYGPPGYVHREFELEGTYASTNLYIYDGDEKITLSAMGYISDTRTEAREEFTKVQRSITTLIGHLEEYLDDLDELLARAEVARDDYERWQEENK